VRCRHEAIKQCWAFTKTVRLKRDGRQRFVSVHEKQDLADAPRFLVTEARHGESGRVLETWSDRWASEIVHEFGTPVPGLEAAQVRKEEAVTRHFRLSGVAPSLLPRAPVQQSTSQRDAFAGGQITFGQQCRARGREVRRALRELVKQLFAEGKSCEELLEVLMPA